MWVGAAKRFSHWHAILGKFAWRVLVAAPLAALGGLTWLRDEFLSPEWQAKLKLLSVLPAWPWHTWVIFALIALLAVVLEGSYREYARLAGAQGKRTGLTDVAALRDELAVVRIKMESDPGALFGDEFVDGGDLISAFNDLERRIFSAVALISPAEARVYRTRGNIVKSKSGQAGLYIGTCVRDLDWLEKFVTDYSRQHTEV